MLPNRCTLARPSPHKGARVRGPAQKALYTALGPVRTAQAFNGGGSIWGNLGQMSSSLVRRVASSGSRAVTACFPGIPECLLNHEVMKLLPTQGQLAVTIRGTIDIKAR